MIRFSVYGAIDDYEYNLNTGHFQVSVKDDEVLYKVVIDPDDISSMDEFTSTIKKGRHIFVRTTPFFEQGFLKFLARFNDVSRGKIDNAFQYSNIGIATGEVKDASIAGKNLKIEIDDNGKKYVFYTRNLKFAEFLNISDKVYVVFKVSVSRNINIKYFYDAIFIEKIEVEERAKWKWVKIF